MAERLSSDCGAMVKGRRKPPLDYRSSIVPPSFKTNQVLINIFNLHIAKLLIMRYNTYIRRFFAGIVRAMLQIPSNRIITDERLLRL